MNRSDKRVKVIFDTDIGCDIDDTWALAYLMKYDKLEPLLILSERGNSEYRLKIVAKMLEHMGRNDIELGYGVRRIKGDKHLMPQKPWVSGYRLSSYKGGIHRDGVGAMIDLIMNAEESILVITAGPLTNIAKAIQREPRIVDRIRLYSMGGSIFEGLHENSKPYPETNIVKDVKAAQIVLASGVNITLAPIDSSKKIIISGGNYKRLMQSTKPEVTSLLENYKIWIGDPVIKQRGANGYETSSTMLYDIMPVYLAGDGSLCELEELRILIDNSGYARIDNNGYPVRCALKWNNVPLFLDHVTETLLR